MSFAARFEDPPRVWGIGRVVVGGVVHPWGVSQDDIDDEAESLGARYAELGLGDNDLVLIVSLLSQAIHVVPLEKAAGTVGALYSSADATPFDAFRTASLVRQLKAKLVVGVDSGVIDGLAEQARDLGEVFPSRVTVMAADEAAATRLADAGVNTGRWEKLGATSAFRAPGDDAFVYDATRWQVDEDDGELLLTNLVPRLTESQRFRTGLHGALIEPGRVTIA
jgi:hypothetical protein